MSKLDVNIVSVNFPVNQYYKEEHPKEQIVLHHTVSPSHSAEGDINWWMQTQSRVATCGIIISNGAYVRLFSSKYWAHHIGARRYNNRRLNERSIGVEIDSAGPLEKRRGKYYTVYGTVIPEDRVQVYEIPYRGHRYYEKYTKEQIETLRKLLIYWGEFYGIPLNYNVRMWDRNSKALDGERGIWSHTSYRDDKSDVHPQPELIEMLISLAP